MPVSLILKQRPHVLFREGGSDLLVAIEALSTQIEHEGELREDDDQRSGLERNPDAL